VKLIDENDATNDTITNFGDYKEGYCMKIETLQPKNNNWIICTDTQAERDQLMSIVKTLITNKQRSKGIFPTQSTKNANFLANIINPTSENSFGQKVDINDTANSKIMNTDTQATWMTLQDWSQCDLACGGGKSTLHRMCVPAKGSTLQNCEGPSVLTRECNTQPCPDLMNINQMVKNTETLKPIIRVMPFSNRPQRYTKCVIKESDLMLHTEKNDDAKAAVGVNFKTGDVQIPTRVIMNNKTLSIFKGVEYDDLIMSFNMATTQFIRSINTFPSCFKLREGKKSGILCPFSPEHDNRTLEEWDYDFNLFKNQCSTPRDVLPIDQGSMQKKLDEKIVR
jgi:hypothetical protein